MNIDEVLLTEKQKEHLIAEALSDNPHWQPDAWGLFDVICKAQCLKLLEWLKEPCENKKHQIGYARDYLGRKVKDCYECMSELESKLKEGR